MKEAPADTKKNYAFESNSSKGWANKKNEWQAERLLITAAETSSTSKSRFPTKGLLAGNDGFFFFK